MPSTPPSTAVKTVYFQLLLSASSLEKKSLLPMNAAISRMTARVPIIMENI